MTHPAQSPFFNLPTELVILILTFAARPNFALIGGGTSKQRDRYSSARALCCVSRDVRRVILPVMLETVFLWQDRQVIAFLHALRMQKGYSEQGNHLAFAYAAHVRRIWVGGICAPRGESSCLGGRTCLSAEPEVDFEILAPVLLAAPSIAIDCESIYLLDGCIQVALRTSTCQGRSGPRWRTNTLTLSGFINTFRMLKSITEGSSFFSSISRLIFVPPVVTTNARHHGNLNAALWTTSYPRSSFANLQTISVAFPYVEFPDTDEPDSIVISKMRIPLITLPVPPLSDRSVDLLSVLADRAEAKAEEAYKNMDPFSGEGVVLRFGNIYCGGRYDLFVNWEEAWARGYEQFVGN